MLIPTKSKEKIHVNNSCKVLLVNLLCSFCVTIYWYGYSILIHSVVSVSSGAKLSSAQLSLNCDGHWGTKDDFTTSFLHFSLFSTALWDLENSRSVHSLMLSSHFFCPPCLCPPFTVPRKMVLARPDEWETCP